MDTKHCDQWNNHLLCVRRYSTDEPVSTGIGVNSISIEKELTPTLVFTVESHGIMQCLLYGHNTAAVHLIVYRQYTFAIKCMRSLAWSQFCLCGLVQGDNDHRIWITQTELGPGYADSLQKKSVGGKKIRFVSVCGGDSLMSSLHKYPLISFRGNDQAEWFGRHAILTERKRCPITWQDRINRSGTKLHGETVLKSAGTIVMGGFDNYIQTLTQTH